MSDAVKGFGAKSCRKIAAVFGRFVAAAVFA
jgi:hypothetical protein